VLPSAGLLTSLLPLVVLHPSRVFMAIHCARCSPVPGITAAPTEDNYRHFNVIIAGPEGSPYEGACHAARVIRSRAHLQTDPAAGTLAALFPSAGVYQLEAFLPEEYPMSPPKVRLLCLGVKTSAENEVLRCPLDAVGAGHALRCSLTHSLTPSRADSFSRRPPSSLPGALFDQNLPS
jgi:hypothetical protein